ncbi:alpha-1,6-mannosylglycoprotein 6-beta-N-acetylglucosaminyltransferase B-like isoform X2 [Lepisosteus oculatus]|uniref:alpha-1,6-mannosylglycoprotein 6-beta-N-acetylglucosaminyltransferase B-like isoform X2 n=1 Tax=Lepisosteus oculatus TaxID=7918 RepID=UPI0035F51729
MRTACSASAPSMCFTLRPRRGCLVLCLGLSLLTLLLQSLWMPESSRETPPGKSPAVEDSSRHGVRRLALRLDALSSQIQRLTRDGDPPGLHDLPQVLQRFKRDHEYLVHTMERELVRVSQKLDQLLQRSPASVAKSRTALEGQPQVCEVPNNPKFPLCAGKVQFLQTSWHSDPCYAFYGVDGTDCSILAYLSEREDFCPTLPSRSLAIVPDWLQESTREKREALIRTDLTSLFEVIGNSRGPAVRFMLSRIKRLSRRWAKAGEKIRQKIGHRPQQQLRVLLYPGVLAGGAGQRFGEMVEKGGPLGELVQWADVSTALYVLGHHLIFASSQPLLRSLIGAAPGKGSCPIQSPLPFDLLYTDYHGLAQLQAAMGLSFHHYRCRYRVLDSFGTEPAFNLREYADRHSYSTAWGSWNLQPLQYMTMFPHTPDNSFLGFVTEELGRDLEEQEQTRRKANIAVIYGKQDYMWQGKESYLDVLSQELEVHGTVYQEPGSSLHLPSYIINHGLLPQDQLLSLLRRAKLFVGLGFPYEGPAPLEAIASGCVFLQPRFQPPRSPQNSDFYRGKPTTRQVPSQHPYAENFIGKPYVWTVDMSNSSEVEPLVPYEFTCEGMLERVFAYISHEDFCSDSHPSWPPETALLPRLGSAGKSCTAVCHDASLVCEPALFHLLNNATAFSRMGANCSGTSAEVNHLFPAYNQRRRRCFLQREKLLFSCAGSGSLYRRLCPCRNYQQGQVALCKGCL